MPVKGGRRLTKDSYAPARRDALEFHQPLLSRGGKS